MRDSEAGPYRWASKSFLIPDLVARSTCSRTHIRVPVGEECLLPATICADEYFFLFSEDAGIRLNQLEPQLAAAHAMQRGRRLDEGTHVISLRFRAGRTTWNFLNVDEVHGFR